MSLSRCLKKLGVSKHEAAIYQAVYSDYRSDGIEPMIAARQAVQERLDELLAERAAVAEQVTAAGGEVAPETSEKAADAKSSKQPKAKPDMARREAELKEATEAVSHADKTGVESVRSHIGWAQRGGKIIREAGNIEPGMLLGEGQGEVTGRTKWIQISDFWPGRPEKLSEDEAFAALDKFANDEKLTPRETRFIAYADRFAKFLDLRDLADPTMSREENEAAFDGGKFVAESGLSESEQENILERAALMDGNYEQNVRSQVEASRSRQEGSGGFALESPTEATLDAKDERAKQPESVKAVVDREAPGFGLSPPAGAVTQAPENEPKNQKPLASIGDSLAVLRQKWADQGVRLDLYRRNSDLSLAMIVVPKGSRKQGIGTQVMRDVLRYADENSLRVILSPNSADSHFGTTSRARLIAFYKRFGFVENKGSNKDFAISESMFRVPQKPLASAWYSPLQRAIDKQMRRIGTGAEWKALLPKLPGVKPEELQWSGINEWLDLQQGKVTREAITDYLKANGVQVTETTLGGATPELRAWEDFQQRMREKYGERYTVDDMSEADDAERIQLSNQSHKWHRGESQTKFASYQLPGGSNYKELLLTLPSKALSDLPAGYTLKENPAREAAAKVGSQWIIEGPGRADGVSNRFASGRTPEEAMAKFNRDHNRGFRSSHFDQPNILAHIRFNERTDASGAKVLFIEEIQSDWAQKGKREGFALPSEQTAPLDAEYRALVHKNADARAAGREPLAADVARARELEAALERSDKSKTPPAPFVGKTDAWVALSIKRMIRYAAENGFDRVAWTNGEQQAARYDLSKHIDRIHYEPTADGNYEVVAFKIGSTDDSTGSEVFHEDEIPLSRVEEVLGKEIAQKIKNNEGQRISGGGYRDWHELKGVDLKVGGEGMKAFYDKIIPNVANDVLKKLGGGRVTNVGISPGNRIEEYQVDRNSPRPRFSVLRSNNTVVGDYQTRVEAEAALHGQQSGFDITPALRENVSNGVPLFSLGRMGGQSSVNSALLQRLQSGTDPKGALETIILHSKSALNKAIARALLKANPTATIQIGRVDDFKDADLPPNVPRSQLNAMFDPDSNRAVLFNPSTLEHDALHEIMHAVTYAALRRGGMSAVQMRRLYQHVLTHGELNPKHAAILKEYGIENLDEFVAEAFSNPEFQALLNEIPAIHGMSAKSVWDWFTTLVRNILGLSKDAHTALSQVLEVGQGLMQEGGQKTEAAPLASRARAEDGRFATVQTAAINHVRDVFTNNKTFSTGKLGMLPGLATSRQKAFVDPENFGPVHQAVQSYLSAVSKFALRATNLAPDVLQQITSVHDAIKAIGKLAHRKQTKADSAALSKALNRERELKHRLADADPEWQALTDHQKTMVAQAHDLIDRSMRDLNVASIARTLRSAGLGGINDMVESGEVQPMLDALQTAIVNTDDPKQKQERQDAYDQAKERTDKIERLIKQGYVPHLRFGDWAIDVIDPAGHRRTFNIFDSQKQANAALRMFQQQFGTGYTFKISKMAKEGPTLFEGVSPDILELFVEQMAEKGIVDPKESEAYQNFLKEVVANNSALKRIIHSKDVPGYDTDIQRVLASFATANARMAAILTHGPSITEAIGKIDKTTHGESFDEAVKLRDYILKPQEEFAKLRSYLFLNFLGGSVASALTNMTQPVMTTFPTLTEYAGTKAAQYMAEGTRIAVARIFKGGAMMPLSLRNAIARGEREGLLLPQEMHQLYAEAIKGLGSSVTARAGMQLMGSFFSVAEQFNRELTFVAAFKTAETMTAEQLRAAGDKIGTPVTDAYSFAKMLVDDTQFIYNKGNRPNWGRGIGAPLLTFRMYGIQHLEMLKRLPPKQRLIALGLLVLASGIGGAPGADDLDDVIDTLGQTLGFDTNSKQAKRAIAYKAFGKTFGDFVLHGVSAGLPLDVSQRLGAGNLIPGTSVFKQSNTGKDDDFLEWFGAAGGLARQVVNAVSNAQDGRYGAALTSTAPIFAQNIVKGAQMYASGEYRSMAGKKVTDVDKYDAIIKGLGFQPSNVAEIMRTDREIRQNVDLVKNTQSAITRKIVQAIIENDADARMAAYAELQQWNQRNPDSPIRILPQSIQQAVRNANMDLQQRSIKSASPSIRGGVRAEWQTQ